MECCYWNIRDINLYLQSRISLHSHSSKFSDFHDTQLFALVFTFFFNVFSVWEARSLLGNIQVDVIWFYFRRKMRSHVHWKCLEWYEARLGWLTERDPFKKIFVLLLSIFYFLHWLCISFVNQFYCNKV